VAVRSDAAHSQSEFLLEHRPFVAKLCRILLRDADESEDAAQQVFLNAYRAVGDGVTPLNVRAWLAQIARNECRSRVRRAAAHPEAPLSELFADGGLDPADAAAQRVLVARLRHELAALPDRQREAVLLREFRGLSYEELAAAMDETGPAVESLLQRARRRLVTRLEDARRPFVGVTLLLDSIRNAVSRLLPGPGATEAVATGGAAAMVAKLAAAGVVAVGVGVAGGDVRPTLPAPPPAAGRDRASSEASVGSRPVHRPFGAVRSDSRGRGESGDGSDRGGPGREAARPEEGRSSSGPTAMPSVTSGEGSESSGSGSSGSGSSGSGFSSSGSGDSGSSGSGSGESGTGSSSSGPGSGSETTSSSGPSDHSGSDSSASSGSTVSGPDSSGSGSSGSGTDSSSGHSGSESSGSGD
jgi:RNA polymerase sigma factor (sigma-70 family)